MHSNCCTSSREGYRHLRLRNSSNQPLELASLFIFSHLDESAVDASLSSQQPDMTSPHVTATTGSSVAAGSEAGATVGRKSAKTLLGRWKDASVDNSEKEVRAQRHKPLAFCLILSSLMNCLHSRMHVPATCVVQSIARTCSCMFYCRNVAPHLSSLSPFVYILSILSHAVNVCFS